MSGNKQVCVSILAVMILMLSISQITKGNNDLAFAPVSEKGLLPKPVSCAGDAEKIPGCVEAVKQCKFKNVKKECCFVLLGLTEDCFGILFPMRFAYREMLKITCKIIGFKPPSY